MNTKSNITISLNVELANLAKELGLNISKTCENALKQAINRLQGISSEFTIYQQRSSLKIDLVDRAGFEPAASALRTRRSYRTDLPARSVLSKGTFAKRFRAFGTNLPHETTMQILGFSSFD